jgi:hypothetical protein
MRRLGPRLARMERERRVAPGCETCRGWTWIVLEGEDGPHRPEQCPACGRVVPATLVVRVEGVAIAQL